MTYEKETTAILQLLNHKMVIMNAGEYCQKNKAIDLSKRMILDNNICLVSKKIKLWKSLLEISDWTIKCEPISEMQVVDALKGNTPGHEFVGISIEFQKREGTIFHTRSLMEDDIIHELLHVRFPAWREEEVDFWTNLLMKRTQAESAENRNALIVT